MKLAEWWWILESDDGWLKETDEVEDEIREQEERRMIAKNRELHFRQDEADFPLFLAWIELQDMLVWGGNLKAFLPVLISRSNKWPERMLWYMREEVGKKKRNERMTSWLVFSLTWYASSFSIPFTKVSSFYSCVEKEESREMNRKSFLFLQHRTKQRRLHTA